MEDYKQKKDERIRKELLFYIKQEKNYIEIQVKSENSPKLRFLIDAIAWLEKQDEHKCDCKYVGCHVNDMKRWCHKKQAEILYEKCNIECSEYLKQDEQEPTDKVEPKFKKGDWITNGIDFTFQVISIEDNYYLRSDDYLIDTETADEKFRLWTIQDAKDGDVLVASDGSIFIFKEVVDCGCKHYIALEEDGETINVNDNLEHFWESIRGITPSTKEQRDLLFSKMKEARYEWDAEKKELKKIEQKPAWSDEDEEMIEGLNNCLDELEEQDGWRYIYSNDKVVEFYKVKNWLKSLKERMKGE